MPHDAPPPSRAEALKAFLYIGLNSFGGPAGQIAVMHRVLVEEKKWLSEQRFLHALNYCMLLPGPEAMQLATYAGWLLHGTAGGVAAGLLFVLPGALVMLALSAAYAGFHSVGLVAAIFFGVKPAVLAVVLEALLRVARRALRSRAHHGIAGAAFCALFFLSVPFPVVIAAAAIAGSLLREPAPTPGEERLPAPALASPVMHCVRVIVVWGAIWWAPVLAAYAAHEPLMTTLGQFFSKAAVVTFGGAYSVLTYIAQDAVYTYGWLEPGQMLDGLGLAETTPGPLILVNQFVGFLAGFQHSHAAAPWWGGMLGAFVASWCTFAPCFLWIFLGAPFIEQLRGNLRLSAALSGITAAVVGVIANLSVWFALHTLFGTVEKERFGPFQLSVPVWETVSPVQGVLALLAGILLLRWKRPMLEVLAVAALAGLVWRWLAG